MSHIHIQTGIVFPSPTHYLMEEEDPVKEVVGSDLEDRDVSVAVIRSHEGTGMPETQHVSTSCVDGERYATQESERHGRQKLALGLKGN